MHGKREQVHIIPLGYEIDRAVRPFDRYPADRVYLLTMKQMDKYGTPEEIHMTARERHFESQVLKILAEKGIIVIIRQIDMFDTLTVMQTVAGIIVEEKSRFSEVKVNMSACGRLTSFATSMAAMAHGVPLYYVRADRYAEKEEDVSCHGLSICEQDRLWELEQIPLALPTGTRMKVLALLSRTCDGLYTWEIIDFLISSEEPGFNEPFRSKNRDEMRKFQRRYHTKLNKSTLTPLINAGYVQQKKVGKYHKITLTSSGTYIAAVSGMVPNGGQTWLEAR